MSQNSVIDIHQDQMGQMWIATTNGLNVYNGYNFKIHKNIRNDSMSLSQNNIRALEEDSEGNIWVGTTIGLNKFSPLNNRFSRYFQSNAHPLLIDNFINCIKEIDHEIWIGTTKGISIFDKKSGVFTSVAHSDEDDNSLSGNSIRKILKGKDGTIWVGTSLGLNKLVRRNNNKLVFEHIGVDSKIGVLSIQDLVEDIYGNIWIGTHYNGLFKLEKKSQNLQCISDLPQFKNLDRNVRALNFDLEGNLWIGLFDGVGVFATDGSLKYFNENTSGYSKIGKVKSICTDARGSVWIGSYFGGVNIWDPIYANFKTLDKNNTSKSLSYNVVGPIISNENDQVYIATEGGGITVLDTKSNKTRPFDKEDKFGLKTEVIKSLLLVNKRDLWIQTLYNGLRVIDIQQNKLRENKISVGLKSMVEESIVHSFVQENDSIIWLGTYGQGLIRYNVLNKQCRSFKSGNEATSGIPNYIWKVLIDSSNRIWIGTHRGLSYFNLKDIQGDALSVNEFVYKEGLNSEYEVNSLIEDSENNIWIGTNGNGFYKFDNSTFSNVKVLGDNFDDSVVNSIVEHDNYLWLGTSTGIVKFNRKDNTATLYDQNDGVLGTGFMKGSALKFKNQLFFGSTMGVTYFNPDLISFNDYAPKVLMTDLKFRSESEKVNVVNSVLEKTITYTEKITLPYDRANFSLVFATPNFINSSENKYAYRLKGLENEFTISTKNEVNYIIQNAGTYVFEVKGANNDGVWNNEITSLEIEVEPAPWRSPFAFFVYALLIVLALFGLVTFLKSKERLSHKLELEQIESERNKEVNKAKLQFFTNISHEFRTPLTLILAPLEQILTTYKGGNSMYKKLLVIENNTQHLFRLINRLMDFRKLENNRLPLEAAEGNIVKFIREIYLSFSEYARCGDYTYTFESVDGEILVYYDRSKLEQVFYNLISNAFRYTPKGGEIKIKIEKTKKDIFIKVMDTGVGISKENIDKIFNRFFEVPIHNEPQKNYNKGTGIGLSIARNIVNLHKGAISVRNRRIKGTSFSVALPLGCEHLQEKELIKGYVVSDDVSHYISQLDDSKVEFGVDVNDYIIKKEKPTILVVEDNKSLRLFIQGLLIDEYNVIAAENGKVAMVMALEYVPDLIVSDVIMPEMVGTELCSEIKKNIRTSHIPVILLTSRSSLIYRFEGLESGADDYISKPFIIKEFKLKIKNILDSAARLRDKFKSEGSFVPEELVLNSIDEELLSKAFKIVEENIGNFDFDINYFCTELGVSRTVLFTKIKAWTKFTPNEFIQEIRLKRAVQLLEQNKLNISQVTYNVGFQNLKYFRQLFQKKFGESPSQYRNKFSES